MRQLSQAKIASIKATDKDQWILAGDGLYLRVRKAGGKSWVVRRKRGGKTQVVTLGKAANLSLREARREAVKLDPKSASLNLKLTALLDEWYEDQIERNYRRPRHVRLYLNRVPPELAYQKVGEITLVEIRQWLRRYAKTRGPVAANRLLTIMKQAFKYAEQVGYIQASPIASLPPKLVGGSEQPRERVLSDDEIKALWKTDSGHTLLLRFLLLTGQRIGETQLARWTDFTEERWEIPAEHTKSNRAHWVPMTRLNWEILDALPHDTDRVFGKFTDTGVQAWLRRWCEREKIQPRFTPHDLRRTFVTRLSELSDIEPYVVEKLVNHSLQGIMKIYNQADYADQRTKAMNRWSEELRRLVQ